MAPELGLFLDECYYGAYNTQFGALHGEIHLSEFQDQVDAFKRAQLYPHIAARDAAEGVNAEWLQTLTDRYYRFRAWHGAIKSGTPLRRVHGDPGPRRADAGEKRRDRGDARAGWGPPRGPRDGQKRTRFGRALGPQREKRPPRQQGGAGLNVSAEFSD